MKSIKSYKVVMGVEYNGELCTDISAVIKVLHSNKKAKIVSWNNGKVLFYFNNETKEIVYPHDMRYTYLLSNKPVTALELVVAARNSGFVGNTTTDASTYLKTKGFNITINPNPSDKFTLR